MRILTRYILLELLTVFLVTLASMTIFIFLGLVGKEAVDKGLGLGPVLRLLPYMLPQAMQFAVPGSLLLATTSVYGRVSSANEIVAIKSLGVSPMSMIWPALVLACVTSLGAVVIIDVAVSWGRGGVERVVLESLEEIAYGRLRTVGSYSTDRLQVNVKHVVGKRMINPIIQFSGSGDEAPSVIRADAAELHSSAAAGAVTIKLFNVDGGFSGWSITHPGEFERSFPLEDFLGGSGGGRSTSDYALSEIGPARTAQDQQITWIKHEMAAAVSSALLFGRMDELSQAEWGQREHNLNWSRRTMAKLVAEPYRRWANGFSCLGFVLIGAPMAIRRRHGEFWGSFFACFLPILLVYYPMLVGCVEQAKNGELPPQAVWLGNLVLAVWGVWLLRRVIRF